MNSQLWQKVNYTQDLNLLKSCDIYEYDIEKANISVLYDAGKISKNLYDFLFNQQRMARQIMIGNMEKRDSEITQIKADGIKEAKRKLFEIQQIQDSEVLSVRNDAIFVLRQLNPDHLKFGHVKFTLRNHYNLFIKAQRIQFYYYYNIFTGQEQLDIKGIRDEVCKIHEPYMIDMFKELFRTYVKQSAKDAILYLRKFNHYFMARQLNIGFYRDIFTGTYILDTDSQLYEYQTIEVDDNMLDAIVISNNSVILRELAKIFYTEYLRTK